MVVVFDLGKVLVDFDYSTAAKRVAARSSQHAENLHELLGGSPLLAQFESGRLTRQQFFSEIQNLTGFDGSVEEFVADFGDIFLPIPAMVELHAELRRKQIPTYIFSNTNDIAVENIRRRFPFFSQFNGYVLSYEVGAMKPEPPIYEALERMSRQTGSEIFYIDDRPENIEAGAARGWQTALHESPEATRAALENFLGGARSSGAVALNQTIKT
jgi:FMN phosphatase YigB (HAD superfamily)